MAKPRQNPLIEEGLIPEIVTAAEDLAAIRDERMDLTKREVAASDTLIAALRKNDLNEYSFNGKRVFIVPGKERVKVRSNDKDDFAEEDEE